MFAEYAKIKYPTLRDIEAGVSAGTEFSRDLIARALGCTKDDLYQKPPETKWTDVTQRKLAEIVLDETEKRERLEEKVLELQSRLAAAEIENEKQSRAFKSQIRELKSQNEELKSQNEESKSQIMELKSQNKELKGANALLKEQRDLLEYDKTHENRHTVKARMKIGAESE